MAAGRVSVNGAPERDADRWIDLESDTVSLDGKPLLSPPPVYVILHKPAGVLTTLRDKKERRTVYDLLPEELRSLRYVGRLDQETTGVLLLTNDHTLAERMTNPRFKVPKTYRVRVERPLTAEEIQRLADGIELSDGRTRPAEVKAAAGDASLIDVTITEGRNRQVRRMLEAVGNGVLSLERIAFGPLGLGELGPGEYRRLSADEVETLRSESASEI